MSLDLSILAVLAVFAAVGYFTGAIQQISHLIGIAAAVFCSKPAAAALAPLVAERMHWPPHLTSVGLGAVSMSAILILATLVSRAIINAIIPGPQRNKPDRVAGLVLGAGKAGTLAWVALSAVISFEKPLRRAVPSVEALLEESSAAAFTRKHGFFGAGKLSVLERLEALAALRGDPKAAVALRKDPALKSLLEHPAFKEAMESKESSALLEDPRFKKLLEDPETAGKLEEILASLQKEAP